ncbi:hypothetical protein F66182_8632 [Fusarium sp. NRRL 66182]|nr:hypothetical protein F66182_8632 [Fusarium sp. NRRL 66182]
MASHNLSGGIPWDRLIEFANEKKAEEAETGSLAQLTKQQSAAISQLIELVPEIQVEDKWKKITVPQFSPAETIQIEVYGVYVQRSRVYCTIPSGDERFPKEGYGYQAGEEVPSFKRAQKAKNFAAMQAYRFLQGHRPSPRGSKRPAPMTQESPAHTRLKSDQDDSDGGASTASPSGSSGAAQTATAAPTTRGPTIRERVALLGGRLNYGIPEYYIERDGDAEDTWKGRPIFNNDGRIPENVGVVTGVVGRQRAEDLVAERVLEWLEENERAKKEQVESILNSI